MTRAIITTYYSESKYLPLWERYYLPFFDEQERYIYPFEMKVEARDRAVEMSRRVNILLKRHNTVVIADLDEYIVPDPSKYKDLGDYMDRFSEAGARVVGYNIIEMPGAAPLDLGLRITSQRIYWHRDKLYDKPMVTTVPVELRPGRHSCAPEFPQDEDLYMFHLRDSDLHYLVIEAGLYRDKSFIDRIMERQRLAEEIPLKWRVI